MNLFRPYPNGEPQRDERGRLMGIDRYQDVLGRNWKRFFLSGLMTILGCLPLTLGVVYAILSSSILVLLPAALIGGGVAGPFIACLYDTVLRALRDAPGRWSANYRKALAQNWRAALLPGALTGLFLGCSAFAGMLFFAWSTVAPTPLTIGVFLFSWLVFLVISTLYWPQLVLFDQSPVLRLRNALLFTVKYFWVTAGTALLNYPDFCAVGLAAKDSESEKFASIQGPGGYLVVHGGTNSLDEVYSVLGGIRGGGTRTGAPKADRHRMAYEFAEFARIVAGKDTAAEAEARTRTLAVMELLDKLHAAGVQ